MILESPPHGAMAVVLSVIGLGGLFGAGLFLAFGRRLAGCSWPRSLLETVSAMILLGGLLLSNSRAALEGLMGRPSDFIRSDKPGAQSPSITTRLPACLGNRTARSADLGWLQHSWPVPGRARLERALSRNNRPGITRGRPAPIDARAGNSALNDAPKRYRLPPQSSHSLRNGADDTCHPWRCPQMRYRQLLLALPTFSL